MISKDKSLECLKQVLLPEVLEVFVCSSNFDQAAIMVNVICGIMGQAFFVVSLG